MAGTLLNTLKSAGMGVSKLPSSLISISVVHLIVNLTFTTVIITILDLKFIQHKSSAHKVCIHIVVVGGGEVDFALPTRPANTSTFYSMLTFTVLFSYDVKLAYFRLYFN